MTEPINNPQLIALLDKALTSQGYLSPEMAKSSPNDSDPQQWLSTHHPEMELLFIERLAKKNLNDVEKIKIICLSVENNQGKTSSEYFWAQPSTSNSSERNLIKLTHNRFPERLVDIKQVLGKPAYLLQGRSTLSNEKSENLFSLKYQLKKNARELSLAALMVNLFSLVIPFFISIYFDLIVPNQASSTLVTLSVGVLIVLCFDLLFKKVRADIAESNAKQYESQLDSWLYDSIFSKPSAIYNLGKKNLRSLLTDINGFTEANSSRFVLPFFDLIFSFVFILAIAVIGGQLFIISLLCFIVASINGLYGARQFIRIDNIRRETVGNKNSFYNSLVSGYEVMSSLGAQKQQRGKFLNLGVSTANINTEMRKSGLRVANATQFLTQLQTLLILIIGFAMVTQNQLTGGNLFAVMLLSGRLAASFSSVYTLLTTYYRYQTALVEIQKIVSLVEDNDDIKNRTNHIKSGAIRCNQVMLNIEGRTLVNQVDLNVNSGEKIALIGVAGSGKTMLTKLIAGLHEPSSGEIFYDGISKKQIHNLALADAITYIPREPTLFPGTLHYNLASAMQADISKNPIVEQLCAFSQQLPNGFQTLIGEDFQQLSYSESRAVTLSRGMLNSKKILLLDEPDHGFDDQWITRLYESITQLKKVTIIATVANRSLLPAFDRILIMNQGQIVHSMNPKSDRMPTA